MKAAPGYRITPAVGSSFSVCKSAADGLVVLKGESHTTIGVDGSAVQQVKS